MAKLITFYTMNGKLNEKTETCPSKEDAIKRAMYYKADSKVETVIVFDGKESIIW